MTPLMDFILGESEAWTKDRGALARVGRESLVGGQRWLLSTTPASVIARKLTVNGNTATLTDGWSLTGLQAPLAPIIVNGVVFVASSGEYVAPAGTNVTEAQLITRSKPAVLYAVNAITDAKLWDSGKTITSFAPHTTALWSSLEQVILSTYDNTFYAFGANMERPLEQVDTDGAPE